MAKICTHNTIFDFIKSGGTKGIGKMGGRGVTLSKKIRPMVARSYKNNNIYWSIPKMIKL